MNVICMACPPGTEIAEKNYPNHMQIIHGTTSAGEAMAKKKMQEQNIPANVPVESLPSPEFMEVANAIDNPEPPLHVPSTPYLTAKTPEEIKPAAFMQNLNGNMDAAMKHPREGIQPVPTPKPVVLKYKYEGNHICGSEVKTIMVTVGEQLTANAYCLQCDETVAQINVQAIDNIEDRKRAEEILETLLHTKEALAEKEELKKLIEKENYGNSNSTKNIRGAKAVRTMPQAK